MFQTMNPPTVIAVSVIVLAIVLMNLHSRRKLALLRARGIYPEPGRETDADVVRLIEEREKILAIRCQRAIHGGGLQDAKEAVEQIELKLNELIRIRQKESGGRETRPPE